MKKELRNIWALALPIMLANILQTAFNVVDMVWVGRLGFQAQASVAMAGVVLLVIMALLIGISYGTQSLIARFTGARNRKGAEDVAMQSLIIGAILSVVLAAAGLVLSRPILRMLGAEGQTLQMGVDYLKIILTGGLAMVYLFLCCAIFRATADAFTPMLIMVGATILNIMLDPLMIFGIGFPRMGVRGAALATVLSRGMASLVALYILFRGSSRLKVHLRRLRVNLGTMLRIIKIGFPNSIQMALRSIVGLILMAIVARYGSYAICAYGIGLRIFSVVLMPGLALAATATTLVGQNLGAQNLTGARNCAWGAAGFNTLLMGLAAVLFFSFSGKLISLFNSDPDIVRLGSEYLKITSLGYVFVAQALVLGHSFIGAGDAVSPLVISSSALLGFQLPLAIILPNHLHIGLAGVWWAILISSIFQGVLTCLWFKCKLSQPRRTVWI